MIFSSLPGFFKAFSISIAAVLSVILERPGVSVTVIGLPKKSLVETRFVLTVRPPPKRARVKSTCCGKQGEQRCQHSHNPIKIFLAHSNSLHVSLPSALDSLPCAPPTPPAQYYTHEHDLPIGQHTSTNAFARVLSASHQTHE